jgi:hypothetical protein
MHCSLMLVLYDLFECIIMGFYVYACQSHFFIIKENYYFIRRTPLRSYFPYFVTPFYKSGARDLQPCRWFEMGNSVRSDLYCVSLTILDYEICMLHVFTEL